MALQVPELSVNAYMPLFISQETKLKTKLVSVIGLIGLTIGIVISLLLYKFTYGHPELRIPGMAIALFLGMWLSRVFVLGPLGFIIGPLVCGLFLTVWEIYGATFKDVLPPVGELVIGQIKKADANLSTSEESEGKTP